jgi:hypothetical protein
MNESVYLQLELVYIARVFTHALLLMVMIDDTGEQGDDVVLCQ